MEFEKKEFVVYQQGQDIQDQFHLDEDFNVPDMKRDVQSIVLAEGKVCVEEMKRVENYIRVSGKVMFKILYVTEEGERKITSMEGKIPFEEMMYTEQEPGENLFVKKAEAELLVQVIHSRKLNVKANVELCISSDGRKVEELMVNLEADGENLQRKFKEQKILRLDSVKRDTYRLKEEFTIAGAKETIGTLIWSDVICRKLDTRIAADEILIQGEMLVFALYESLDGKTDWVEQCIPYQGKLNCYGASDALYHEIYPDMKDAMVEVRMNEDGEMRVLYVEATLEMRVILYEEESIQILEDVYVLDKECQISREDKKLEQLLMQNHSKCKVCEKLLLPELKDDILQICHSNAKIQIDHTTVKENGVQTEGILHVNVLYVKPDDSVPFGVWQGMVPFSCMIESNETSEDMQCSLQGIVEQLSIGLLGNNEMEVKAVLSIQSFMKRPMIVAGIQDVTLKPVNIIDKMPGIIGYIVKDGDNLWNLAKKYNTTMESIAEGNNLEKMDLKCGQKILIFKENVSIL